MATAFCVQVSMLSDEVIHFFIYFTFHWYLRSNVARQQRRWLQAKSPVPHPDCNSVFFPLRILHFHRCHVNRMRCHFVIAGICSYFMNLHMQVYADVLAWQCKLMVFPITTSSDAECMTTTFTLTIEVYHG